MIDTSYSSFVRMSDCTSLRAVWSTNDLGSGFEFACRGRQPPLKSATLLYAIELVEMDIQSVLRAVLLHCSNSFSWCHGGGQKKNVWEVFITISAVSWTTLLYKQSVCIHNTTYATHIFVLIRGVRFICAYCHVLHCVDEFTFVYLHCAPILRIQLSNAYFH